MVEMETLKQKLERILGMTLREKKMSQTKWNSLTTNTDKRHHWSEAQFNRKLYFLWKQLKDSVIALEIDEDKVSESERKLIELLLETYREANEGLLQSNNEDEWLSKQLGAWLNDQLHQGYTSAVIPDHIGPAHKLHQKMVPFLLICENIQDTVVSYGGLNKLMTSYFGGDIQLILLSESKQRKEWLILTEEHLITGGQEDKEEGEETEKELLSALCYGMYEVIASEWPGTFHISAAPVMDPISSLLSTVSLLRETAQLGRAFYVTEHIHLPWELQLERLIYSIPPEQRDRFIQEAEEYTGLYHDKEIIATLDAFFKMDCNVSETAKHLYIHRNTLIYRLDKFKQETGLDVRSFKDAVAVKLMLLLYKLTKTS
ncbi:helix-turn-helix domain-containing protein [Paenibacillus sediminis]|uniref:PucR C-terminal helix-turn-helix domain-containing protein n=1 Tax=Paenibacillus sediminis TaxID=664909 RepID=A0ABS4H3K3_9BACL|nr:helix-turn-helix domain-containing protein [Paenibacillus sediminis]MBP1937099.1 hypothetical protein [Paenibacillus sediminis]